ncbi:hypothetical protein LC087_12700 [Bacillus carboniphilus]|uniref:Uncharacterized protein n=1 Tax=Bacillus carboniphilus TaxID=86663 RepID=A0ABY9JTU8_9BACI|nr:hypothetical protein [Bacillus carboniphilus]WLR41718.1 hypothetical protein LC087_12700 [Bacillus carboniphilus]
MLKLSYVTEPVREHLEIDQFIPINVTWHTDRPKGNGNLYWRATDKTSLLEIGIEPNDGLINSITLTIIQDVRNEIKENIGDDIRIQQGLPAFNISGWPKKRFEDEIIKVKVGYSNNVLHIFFSDNFKVNLIITNDRVSFGFDEQNNLCLIVIDNLNEIENKILRDSLSI